MAKIGGQPDDLIETKCGCGVHWITRRDAKPAPAMPTIEADVRRLAALGLVHLPADAAESVKAIVERLSLQFGYLPPAERERLTAEIAGLLPKTTLSGAHPYRDPSPAQETPPAPEKLVDALPPLRALTPVERALSEGPLCGYKHDLTKFERRDEVLYDTLLRNNEVSRPLAMRTYLFGNANVGRFKLTNMQCGGTLASDKVMDILGLQLMIDFADKGLEERVRRNMQWRLDVSEHTQREGWAGAIHDVTTIVPLHIPARQYFNVVLEFTDSRVLDAVNAYLGESLIRFDMHTIEYRERYDR